MGVSRRGVLLGGAAGVAVAGGLAAKPLWDRLTGPDLHIPDVPEGDVRLESVRSDARGREVDLFTAVPHGHGDGAGLPVCLVLHGASSRPADFQDVGIPKLLTAAVQDGARPFVLAGADGGSRGWDAAGADEPFRMLLEEVPDWLDDRGFDASRQAAWGWSMGGYGALRLAQQWPALLRAVAAFSPAVTRGDPVFAAADRFGDLPVGLWCGTDDPLVDSVRALEAALSPPPEVASYDDGAHDFEYWTRQAEAAFQFLGTHF